jgi:hypothetical protein
VDRDARGSFPSRLYRVEDCCGLTVAESDDEVVGTITEVVEHIFGRATFRGERSRYLGRLIGRQTFHGASPIPWRRFPAAI